MSAPSAPTPAAPLTPPTEKDRVLLFAPHPDDESIATGGLLALASQAGASLRIVIVTSGENNPWAQRAFERRLGLDTRARMCFAGRREREALEALAALGIGRQLVSFLRLPDQGLTQLLLRDPGGLCSRLAEELRRSSPTILIGPSAEDLHPDHSALAVAIELALTSCTSFRPRPTQLAFVVHNPQARRRPLAGLSLPAAVVACKSAAISRHASQLILRGNFLRSFAGTMESYTTTTVPPPAPPHPIEGVDWQGSTLKITVRPRFKARAFGPATLILLPGSGATPAMTTPLPARGGSRMLTEWATASAVPDSLCRRQGHRLELSLPAHFFAHEHTLFLKLERRFGFFDEAGWVRIQRGQES